MVVGIEYDAADQERAFRWTASGGMQDLGTLGGPLAWAFGVSADGSVVVGQALNAAQWRAFRWTESGGRQDLGPLGGTQAGASGVSADGSVVGYGSNAAVQGGVPLDWPLPSTHSTGERSRHNTATYALNHPADNPSMHHPPSRQQARPRRRHRGFRCRRRRCFDPAAARPSFEAEHTFYGPPRA